ncbi:MAG: GAF domain-containing protein [Chloroflexota bacterium]
MSTTQTDLQRHATLLKAAARAARLITMILDPQELLQRTVDIICDEFEFYYAGVFLLDPNGQYAVLRAGRGEAGKVMLAEGHKLAVGGNSMIGACIQNRQGRIALDVGAEAVFFENPHLPSTRSEMALPLIVGGEPIGALTVQSTQEAAFHDEDVAALQTMADQLAVAIHNSSLHREKQEFLRQAERRSRLLGAANRVGKEVTSILELEVLLPHTVNIICDAYGFYYAGVFLVDESGEWAVLRAGYGEAGKAMLAEGHRLKVGPGSMIGAAISFGEARIALDVGEERVHFKNPHLPHTRSEMALPLIFGKQVLGAVTVQSVEERAFSQDDITTLLTMAEHLAVAINNARTLDALKQAHAEILRARVFEALTTATTEAIHWIGNKTLPISMTVARLQEETADGKVDIDSLREDLAMIAESADQIIQVKEQLIGAVRDQAPRPVLLADILRTAMLQRGLDPSMLEASIAPEAAYTIADSTQLVRAFGNLLQNAAEAGARSIHAQVGPAGERGMLHLTLVDDGAGMSADMLSKAWSPFYTTKGSGHHGLGLPAALHVISQAQGRMDITSEPGKGAQVEIWLPLAYASASPVVLPGGALAVLLIDDNDEWAQNFTQDAKKAGAKIARQSKLDSFPSVDLLLVDEHAASFSMDDVLAAVKEAGLAGKTIVLTAALNPERVTRYLRAGLRDVRPKPYTAQEISALFG